MEPIKLNITFRPIHRDVFAELSYDRSPLHVDSDYARRTFLGQPVLHGMAVVLQCLGLWSRGRRFLLSGIRAEFKKPILLDKEYRVEIMEGGLGGQGASVKIAVYRGPVAQAKIQFGWRACGNPNRGSLIGWQPIKDARCASGPLCDRGEYPYHVNLDATAKLKEYFALDHDQFPTWQLNALCWCSYFVGMDFPGVRALLSSIDFAFEEDSKNSFGIELTGLSTDERVNLVTIKGIAGIGNPFELKVFRRPELAQFSLSEIEKVLGKSTRYSEKRVIVTGGTRGFGAVIAAALLLHGARVVIPFRGNWNTVGILQREFAQFEERIQFMSADLEDDSSCRALGNRLRSENLRCDILVNCAVPAIHAALFLEMEPEEFRSFVDRCLRLLTNVIRQVLPLLSKGGAVVNVSTDYMESAAPGFSHYLAAKGALEGFTRGLAAEHRDLDFIVVRPPRMLTDQTNLPYQLREIASPIQVAKTLLFQLENTGSKGNFTEITLASCS